MQINFSTVREAAHGRWPEALVYLGVDPTALSGKHGPCPACGGKDRFRYLNDDEGGWICGQGGITTGGDGFSLLEHCGWAKRDALRAVAQYFNIENISTTPEQRNEIKQRQLAWKRAKYEAALSRELHVLSQVVNHRVSGRELAGNWRFRNERPEWTPPSDEHWEREILAARRIKNGLEALYGI